MYRVSVPVFSRLCRSVRAGSATLGSFDGGVGAVHAAVLVRICGQTVHYARSAADDEPNADLVATSERTCQTFGERRLQTPSAVGTSACAIQKDPSPVLPVLEQLKEDPSLYVRKSVANNLNDIAKDHPDIVIRLAKAWLGNHPDTDWIVRHACRTLIRKAEPDIMRLFGYSGSSEGKTLVQSAVLTVEPKKASIGDNSMIHYELCIREGTEARLRIEYGIYFVKANGQTPRKLFLLSDKTVPGGSELTGRRKHGWSDLTTRRHYPGEHRIVLVVNGEEVAEDTLWLNA